MPQTPNGFVEYSMPWASGRCEMDSKEIVDRFLLTIDVNGKTWRAETVVGMDRVIPPENLVAMLYDLANEIARDEGLTRKMFTQAEKPKLVSGDFGR